MTITREEAVDMAWKVEGLYSILKQRQDPRAVALGDAGVIALCWQEGDPRSWLEDSYRVMEQLSKEFDYDSGKRKFSPEPEQPKPVKRENLYGSLEELASAKPFKDDRLNALFTGVVQDLMGEDRDRLSIDYLSAGSVIALSVPYAERPKKK